ncbi:hypothetical protein ACFL59_07415, partial [Planctomycetota bacterium]
MTPAAGVATFSFNLRTPGGDYRVAATSALAGVSVTATSDPFIVSAGAPKEIVTTAASGTVGSSVGVLYQLYDAFGNPTAAVTPVTGDPVVVSETGSALGFDPPSFSPTSVTFGVGAASASTTVTDEQAEQVIVSMTNVAGIAQPTITQATFDFAAANADHLVVSAPGGSNAGDSVNVTVTAVDPFGNVDTGFGDTVRFTSTDPTATLPSDYTFVPGTAGDGGMRGFSVTLANAGVQTVAVSTVGHVPQELSATATVTVNVVDVSRKWVGGASPDPTDWSNGDNWDPQGAPSGLDDAHIDDSATVQPRLTSSVEITDLRIDQGASLDTNGFTVTASGDVISAGITGTGELSLIGAGKGFAGTVSTEVSVGGSIVLTGTANTSGDLTVDASASLAIGTHTLTVGGSFVVTDDAGSGQHLIMNAADGRLICDGNATFGGANDLSAGTVELRGDLTQQYNSEALQPLGTLFVLNGTDPQALSFADPGASHFGDLEVASTGEVTLHSLVAAMGQLRVPDTVTPVVSGAGTMVLVAVGLDVDGLVLDSVHLVGNGGPITRFDNVTFRGQDRDATQFEIRHSSLNTTFRNLTFEATPNNGKYFAGNGLGGSSTLTIESSRPLHGQPKTSVTNNFTIHWGDPSDDTDGDGVTDAQEFIDGTDPLLAPPGSFDVVITPDPVTSGTQASVTITAKTTTGALATDYEGTVALTTSDKWAQLSDAVTFTAADHGVKTISVTFVVVGTQTLAVADTMDPTVAGSDFVTVQFPQTPAGFTRTWRGGTITGMPTDWSNAENWDPTVVPGDGDNVYISVAAFHQPELTAAGATANRLRIDLGGSLETNGHTITAKSDVSAAAITGTGTLTMSGSGLNLAGNVPNLVVGGSVSLAGDCSVAHNLTINNQCTLSVGPHALAVGGKFTVLNWTANSHHHLVMNDGAGRLIVDGVAKFGAMNSLATGTIELRGGLTQQGHGGAVQPAGTLFLFSGTSTQSVSFANPSPSASYLRSVAIDHDADVTFATAAHLLGSLSVSDNATLTFATNIWLTGEIALSATGRISQAAQHEVYFTQTVPYLPSGTYDVPNNAVSQSMTLTRDALIPSPANLGIANQVSLTLAEYTLTVDGNFTVSNWTANNHQHLIMDNGAGRLIVHGMATFGAMNFLATGTIELRGGFVQRGHGASIQPSGTLFLFRGSSPQSVSFVNPGEGSSFFTNVTVDDGASVTFSNLAYVLGRLSVRPGAVLAFGSNMVLSGDVDLQDGARISQGASHSTSFITMIPLLDKGTYDVPDNVVGRGIVMAGDALFPAGANLRIGQQITLTLGEHTLTAHANFTVPDWTANDHQHLSMNKATGKVIVHGVATFGAMNNLATGTLELRGGFVQRGQGSSIRPGGTLFLFRGSSPQSASFVNPGEGSSFFRNITVDEGANVTFSTLAYVLGRLSVRPSAVATFANNMVLSGDIDLPEGARISQGASHTTSFITKIPYLDTGTYDVPDNLVARGIVMAGDALFPAGANLRIGQQISLTLGEHTLTAHANFTVPNWTANSHEHLIMGNEAGRLVVHGLARFGGMNHLATGTIELHGGFTQSGHAQSVRPSGTLFLCRGSSPQSISFANPGEGSSFFKNITVDTDANVTFGTFAYVLGRLSVRPGAVATFANNMVLSGDVDLPNGARISQGSAHTTSYITKLPYLDTGTYDVPDNLMARGIVMTGDGLFPTGANLRLAEQESLTLGKHTLTAYASFTVPNWTASSHAHLIMGNDAGRLIVHGLARFGGMNSLATGTIELRGGLAQSGHGQSIRPTGTLFVFRGSSPQSVSFANPGEGSSFLKSATADTDADVTFNTMAYVTGRLTVEAGANVTFASNIALSGDLDLDAAGSISQSASHSTSFLQAVPFLPSGTYTVPNNHLVRTVTMPWDGLLPVGASLTVNNQVSVILGGRSLEVGGGFTVANLTANDHEHLIMEDPADSLVVHGMAHFGAMNRLATGTIELRGGLRQRGHSQALRPSGTLFRFAGTSPQAVSFSNPSTGSSHLKNVEVISGANLSLESACVLTGELCSPSGGQPPVIFSPTAQRLTCSGVDVDGLLLANALLTVNDSETLAFQNVELTGYSPAATQLTLNWADRAATFSNLVFRTAPSSGVYIAGNHTGSTASTLDVISSLPMYGKPKTTTGTGFTINWGLGNEDSDNDGFSDAYEFQHGTDPLRADADRFDLVIATSTVPAGDTIAVTVTARDTAGAVFDAFNRTVLFSSTDGKADLPTPYTFDPASDHGTRVFNVRFIETGSQVLTVIQEGNSAAVGTDTVTVQLPVTPQGFTKTWKGGHSVNPTYWSQPENWEEGAVPQAGDNVYVSGARPYQPVLTANASIGGILATLSANVNTNGKTLVAAGDVVSDAGISGSGWLELAGATQTLTGSVSARVRINGAVSLASDFVASSDLTIMPDRYLHLAANTLRVEGALLVSSLVSDSARHLRMTDPQARLLCLGNATFYGQNAFEKGILEFKGSCYQGGDPKSLRPAAELTVLFTGAAPQEVSFANPGSSSFSSVEFRNSSGVTLASDAYVTGNLIVADGAVVNTTRNIHVTGLLRLGQNATYSQTNRATWLETAPPDIKNGTYSTLLTKIDGDLTLVEDLLLPPGAGLTILINRSLDLASNTLQVGADFTVDPITSATAKHLRMSDPQARLIVLGNASFGGQNTLEQGTIELRGACYQNGDRYSLKLLAGVLVLFDGSAEQTVSFANPGDCFFSNVEVRNVAGVNLASDVHVTGDLTVADGAVLTTARFLYVTGLMRLGQNAAYTQTNKTTWFKTVPPDIKNGTYGALLTEVDGDLTLVEDLLLPPGSGLSIRVNRSLDLASNTLQVGANFTVDALVSDTARHLRMTDSQAKLVVLGDATFGGRNTLDQGTIELSGGCYQNGDRFSLKPLAGVSVLFDGSAGQTVSFVNPGDSSFSNVEVRNSSGMTFSSNVYVTGDLTLADNVVLSTAYYLHVTGLMRLGQNAAYTQTSKSTLFKTVPPDIKNGTYSAILTEVDGDLTLAEDLLLSPGSGLNILANRSLDLASNTLQVGADFTVAALVSDTARHLRMTDPQAKLIVLGNATVSGQNRLEKGTIELRGNFTQAGDRFSLTPLADVSFLLSGGAAQT